MPLGHPSYLCQQAELSLRRLRTDRIDLLHLHRLDPACPIADQVGALAQLQQEGKVRHIGLSEVTVEQLEEARRTAPVAAVQNLYNLAAQRPRGRRRPHGCPWHRLPAVLPRRHERPRRPGQPRWRRGRGARHHSGAELAYRALRCEADPSHLAGTVPLNRHATH
ncbi:aldo/keto reductase [Streptomyces chartreusis]